MIKADIIAGARPNFIKAGPIYRAMDRSKEFIPRFINTGQHVIPIMEKKIYKSVGLKDPEVILGENSNPGISYVSEMMYCYDLEIKKNRPDVTLALGDTDSAFACAYVAKRNNVPVVHVEAGNRSGSSFSPEEMNRKTIDHISDLLCAPMKEAVDNLVSENVVGKIVNVGNIMIDSLVEICNSRLYENIKPINCDVLVTLHRSENVDNLENLKKIVSLVNLISGKYRVHFPVHPRTMNKLSSRTAGSMNNCFPPLDYPKFLKTLSKCKAVLTDSGGVQAEASYLGIPCIILARNTGWINLLKMGLVRKASIEKALPILDEVINQKKIMNSIPLWDGKTSERILKSIYDYTNSHI